MQTEPEILRTANPQPAMFLYINQALSSTEAEFMSLTAAIQESILLKRLEAELNPQGRKTMLLHCDNKGAKQDALNNNYSSIPKHVDIRAKSIRQKIDKEVVLKYLCTDKMVTDILTKAVTPQKLNNFVHQTEN